MKNLADDVIELINFIRPENDKIQRDLIFNNPKYGYLLDLKEGGIEYFKKINGYISYYRGVHPLLFAKQVDMGVIPKELNFIKLIQCKLEKFQLKLYNEVKENIDDALEKGTEAVSNFVFPGLNDDNSDLIGVSGIEGFKKLRNQLDNNAEKLLKLINKNFFNNKIDNINNIFIL